MANVLGCGEMEVVVVEIDVANRVLVLAPRARKASLAGGARWVEVRDGKEPVAHLELPVGCDPEGGLYCAVSMKSRKPRLIRGLGRAGKAMLGSGITAPDFRNLVL